MKVKIEGHGHCVEVDGSALDYTLDKVLELAETTWFRTKGQAEPRQQIGFGAQVIERAPDRHAAGDPLYRYGDQPTTAKEENDGGTDTTNPAGV